MPAVRPCAAFEPISPDFDVKKLVESTANFDYAPRINVDMVEHKGIEQFEKLVRLHVITGGKPLVIEGYEQKLDRWTFALQWLRDNCAAKIENARDLTRKINVPLSIGHYLNHMALLTNQWNEKNYKEPARQRMYLKDIDSPQLWHEKLQDIIPQNVFYLNESIGEYGGLGSVDEADISGSGTRKGRGVAKSGDLMSSLPREMRAENLMCYIGHEGTYTPAHKEMCASLGQNIMVETSTGAYEDGKLTKPGSSIWFMTESKEKEVVSEYWLSKLGHDVEVESHFAQVNAWRAAPFKTWVVEQQVGDLILIPPLAPHQVWNRGTRTMKVAWNRTTVETLEMALHNALPAARMVCRDEQYKNKAIIYYTLKKYSKLIEVVDKQEQRQNRRDPASGAHLQNLKRDFCRLQALSTEILLSESFYPSNKMHIPKPEMIEYDSFITCSYCRCNIFNRFLTCPSCVSTCPDGEQDTYDICMDCYAMGRSCACISKLKWVEQWSWRDLMENHEKWRHQILQIEGKVTDQSAKSLRSKLESLGKHRTLAQVCQSELARRPFNDITKPKAHVNLRKGEDDDEPQLDMNGNLKKAKKKSEKFTREHGRCHVDCHWEPKWKQADCSICDKKYCFGLLFRAYDMMPQDILANPNWLCPSCRNICSCRHCKDNPGFKPYTPSGTMLGHNTKAIADPRSVESLVDFGYSNISWIQKMGDDNEDNTRRMKKRQIAAEKAKMQDSEAENAYEQPDNAVEDNILILAQQEGIPIDPALTSITAPNAIPQLSNVADGSQDDEDEYDENPEQARAEYQGFNGPPAPQYMIPAGGVVRDAEHAYDNTEAITYDYPDPEMGLQLPVPADDTPREPPVATGYEPAVQVNNSDIAMIGHQRKRTKVDEGDMPCGRPHPYKKKKLEQRKSLIVKLNVNRTKLAEVQSIRDIAQQALNGVVTAGAPVISSDLHALNVYGGTADGQSHRKKARLEEIESEQDEFMPGRYRDRRKTIPVGELRSDPDADITRRQTRMQVTNYEEPADDDIFDDIADDTWQEKVNSKLTTMERAEKESHDMSENDDTVSLPQDYSPSVNRSVASRSRLVDHVGFDTTEAEAPPKKSAPVLPRTGGILRLALANSSPVAKQVPPAVNRSAFSTSKLAAASMKPQPQPTPSSSKALLEAKANKMAKMAIMENGDCEVEDGLEVEDQETPEDNVQAVASHSTPLVKSKTLPAISNTPVLAQRQLSSKPILAAVPSAQEMLKLSVASAKAQVRKVAPMRVSAADWGDSDSDSDSNSDLKGLPLASSLVAVNQSSRSNLKAATEPKARGQPPISLNAGQKR